MLELLRFHQEIRNVKELEVPEAGAKSYKISEKELTLAQQLVESMSTKWEPQRYHDDYRDALLKWIKKKSKSAQSRTSAPPVAKKEKTSSGKVVDMMSLLKKSIQKAQPSGRAKKRKSASLRKSRKAS